MKKLLSLVLLLSTFNAQVSACEFTSIKAKVKVESRTLDYRSHKEKIDTVGTISGKFIKNSSGSHKIFNTSDKDYQLAALSISEKYDYYTTKVNLNTTLAGDVVIDILKDAIGERKLRKNPEIAALVNLINPASQVGLSSSFYAFHGSYYGETDDETEDAFEIIDPANKDNKLIVTFNFKRKTKCD